MIPSVGKACGAGARPAWGTLREGPVATPLQSDPEAGLRWLHLTDEATKAQRGDRMPPSVLQSQTEGKRHVQEREDVRPCPTVPSEIHGSPGVVPQALEARMMNLPSHRFWEVPSRHLGGKSGTFRPCEMFLLGLHEAPGPHPRAWGFWVRPAHICQAGSLGPSPLAVGSKAIAHSRSSLETVHQLGKRDPKPPS